jgi:hypothetical protein
MQVVGVHVIARYRCARVTQLIKWRVITRLAWIYSPTYVHGGEWRLKI